MKIHHAAIIVSDIVASQYWYENLGLKKVYDVTRDEPFIANLTGIPGAVIRVAYMQYDKDSSILELIQYLEPKGAGAKLASGPNFVGTGHVCFEVDRRTFDETKEVEELIGFARIPDGKNSGCRIVYVRDPDNYIVELMHRP